MLAEEDTLERGFLGLPAPISFFGSADHEAAIEEQPVLPTELGNYRILEVLGRGGMGTVYLGEQTEPVRRHVAIKVLDRIHDPSRRKRFAAEGQALARLKHPNVAALYEVGSTDSSLPYVAMEYVDGEPIHRWCDQHGLNLRERIEVFLGACAGVSHAHEKSILHRDLKPSNVLVTEVDGSPTAKVIDFGIARALDDESLHGSTRLTLDYQLVGSPAYMSPEALTLGPDADLDTRSDVYSLGLLLFELLSGLLPFGSSDPTLASILQRLSMEEELTLPSVCLKNVEADEAERLASLRGMSRESFGRGLRGDLDAIVRKAVARDRSRRYASPAELASDLERYLDDQPIRARPPSTVYVLGLFLKRRRGVVAASIALVLALVAGIIGRSLEADRANREASRAKAALVEAEDVSQFLIELFEVADPERKPGDPIDVQDLLQRAEASLDEKLEQQPLAVARLRHTLGEIYSKLGQLDVAERQFTHALELRQQLLPDGHGDRLDTLNWLGTIYRRLGRLEEAETTLEALLLSLDRRPDTDPVEKAAALNSLGNVYWNQLRLDEAAEVHRSALVIREAVLGADHADTAESLNNLGAISMDRRDWQSAERYFSRADEILRHHLGAEHPRVAVTVHNRGIVARGLSRWDEALELSEESISLFDRAYGDHHHRALMARSWGARLLYDMGRLDEAADLASEVLSRGEQNPSARLDVIRSWRVLGACRMVQRDFEGAERALRQDFELRLERWGPERGSVLGSRSLLAWLDLYRGRPQEALDAHREILADRQRLQGEEHRSTAWSRYSVGVALAGLGRRQEAITELETARAVFEGSVPRPRLELGATLRELGLLLRAEGREREAAELLAAAREDHSSLPPGHQERLRTEEAAGTEPSS
ncbi:MAG: serine/threonine-protein kinase [Thermoanaerobaculia bacterium]|nr:serine/threonine-protein kinase [Thermoanaerobaculia bacterium]